MTEEAAESALLLHACDAPGKHTLTLNQPRAFSALSDTMLDVLPRSVDCAANNAGARTLYCVDRSGVLCNAQCAVSAQQVGQTGAQMLLIGEFISAEEARQQGLANRVVRTEAFDGAVDAPTHSILGKPQAATAMGKALFYKQQGVGFDAAYQLASQAIAVNRMSLTAPKGVRALIEKRRAQWPAAVY